MLMRSLNVYAKKRSNRHRRKSCEGRGAELITNGEIHDLTPRFRESAYTPIKKLIGENIPGDFDHMKSRDEQMEFLRKILTGNLLSMSKSLDYQVPDRIKCDLQVRMMKNRLKDVNVMAFVGRFQANFLIPDYLGVGKSVSRGFGVVRHVAACD